MASLRVALTNLERAHGELTAYLALPITHQRDKAGIIQAFEFTFELFWKMFQKLAPDAGLEAATPREALQAGIKLRLIATPQESAWLQMLRDRNLTSHTYRAEVADEVVARIQKQYAVAFSHALEKLRGLAPGWT